MHNAFKKVQNFNIISIANGNRDFKRLFGYLPISKVIQNTTKSSVPELFEAIFLLTPLPYFILNQ